MLQKTVNDNQVACNLCEHHCVIPENQTGYCGMRLNVFGELHSLNYGKTIAAHVDPIEKKPLFHFLPHTYTYSLAAPGCNFSCPWCQNYEISQMKYVGFRIPGKTISPKEHVNRALKAQVQSISYTYSEPTVFLEYALDIMKLAKENNLYNIWVTNAFMTEEALDLILPYLDAANVDYKSGDKNIYQNIIHGKLEPVLRNIRKMFESGVHVEVTTLIVPGVNDSSLQLTKIANDIASISTDIPWHITRYYPSYKYISIDKTHIKSLNKAYQIGLEAGIKHIHLGNV